MVVAAPRGLQASRVAPAVVAVVAEAEDPVAEVVVDPAVEVEEAAEEVEVAGAAGNQDWNKRIMEEWNIGRMGQWKTPKFQYSNVPSFFPRLNF